jgi:hypothetical protein
MGMFDYDTSTPGIQGPPVSYHPDGSIDLVGDDPYKVRRDRTARLIEGATPQALWRASRNYAHPLEAVRGMWREQQNAGDASSIGSFIRLQDGTSSDETWGAGLKVLDLAHSLYQNGYSTKQVNDIIVGSAGEFKDVGPANWRRGWGNMVNGQEVPEGHVAMANPYAMAGAPMMGFITRPENPEQNQRRERSGAWGAGHGEGGYGMLSPENEEMRKSITNALEEKLLG